PAGAAADDHLHGPVLGADGVGGAAPGAVDGVDPGPDRARSVLHPAGAQHRDHVGHAEAHADDRHGPDAAEDDADHAADLRRDPGLPARGPGAVPGGQRRTGPAAAVGDHQEVRRAAAQAGGGEELTCTGPPQGGPWASGSAKLPAMHDDRDTIVAIATAPGAGGVGIVRLSGPRSAAIAREVCGKALRRRIAHHVRFLDAGGATIDDGIALYFRAPASYTGQDVVELQAHGSRAVLQ